MMDVLKNHLLTSIVFGGGEGGQGGLLHTDKNDHCACRPNKLSREQKLPILVSRSTVAKREKQTACQTEYRCNGLHILWPHNQLWHRLCQPADDEGDDSHGKKLDGRHNR